MFSVEIVVRDGLSDLSSGRSMMFVFGHFEFCLECSKARFHERVVITIVGADHALSDTRPAKVRTIPAAGILTAAIRVVNHLWCWVTFTSGGLESGDHQLVRHRLFNLPANDPSGILIHEDCELAKASISQGDIADVADPQYPVPFTGRRKNRVELTFARILG